MGIPKPEYTIAMRFNQFAATAIRCLPFHVLAAINYQPLLLAAEGHKEVANRELAAKPETLQLRSRSLYHSRASASVWVATQLPRVIVNRRRLH